MSVLSISLDKLMTLSEAEIKAAVITDLVDFLQEDIPESSLDSQLSSLGSGYYVDSVAPLEWNTIKNEQAGNITCTGTMNLNVDINGAEDTSTSHTFQGAFECVLFENGFERVNYTFDSSSFNG